MNDKHKGLASIIVLLIIILLGIGGLLISQSREPDYVVPFPTQTPNPTLTSFTSQSQREEWKIFTNTELGYSLEYPSDWFDKGADDFGWGPRQNFGNFNGPSAIDSGRTDPVTMSVMLLKRTKLDNQSISGIDYFNTLAHLPVGNTTQRDVQIITKVSDFELLGWPAIRVRSGTNPDIETSTSYSHRVYILRDEQVFSISLGAFSIETLAANHKIYNQILSTFKFLDKDVDTSDLKSYASESGKYSIEYPDEYEFLENKIVSADGVRPVTENTITLISSIIPEHNTNFALSINHSFKANASLQVATNENDWCTYISEQGGEPIVIDKVSGLIFKNTPCGHIGATAIYVIKNDIVYLITITSNTGYDSINEQVDQILSTFKFLE